MTSVSVMPDLESTFFICTEIAAPLFLHYNRRMRGKQGKNGGHSRNKRIQVFLLAAVLGFLGLGPQGSFACDVDLIALLEAETASVPAAVPWMRAAHAIASLSDALNAGQPSGDAVSTWNDATMALFETWVIPSRGLRTEMGSTTWRIQYLLNTGEYIQAHEAIQRQFRLVLRCLAALGLPARPAALAELAGRVWSLVESARDRDEKRFVVESAGLASAAEELRSAWNVPADSPLEAVSHWSGELGRVSSFFSAHRDEWPDELFHAVS